MYPGISKGTQLAGRLLRNERLLRALAVALVLTLILAVFLLREQLPGIRSAGYLGVFVLSFVGSASILVPVPGIAAVCAGPGLVKLFPLGVALLASVAESVGEVSGYLIGYSGRGIAEHNRFYPRIVRWMEHRGGLVLFLVSSIPNPLFDLIGIAAGTLRYPIWRFLAAVWAGKLVKSLIIAYTCFYGFGWALRFFGLE
ncbi:MAG: VTT domain-containing protein [Chloroflexi bacterium]|nr:VTT domain-containing protein [Chloroflexota bacterium]